MDITLAAHRAGYAHPEAKGASLRLPATRLHRLINTGQNRGGLVDWRTWPAKSGIGATVLRHRAVDGRRACHSLLAGFFFILFYFCISLNQTSHAPSFAGMTQQKFLGGRSPWWRRTLVPGTEPPERHDVAGDVYNTTLGDLKAHDCVNFGIFQAENIHKTYIYIYNICEPPPTTPLAGLSTVYRRSACLVMFP